MVEAHVLMSDHPYCGFFFFNHNLETIMLEAEQPPRCIIKTTSSRLKRYTITLHSEHGVTEVHQGKATEDKLRDILTDILNEYPNVRFRGPGIPARGSHLHVFKIHNKETDEARRFIKTHQEVSNPFRNRKRYAMVNPDCTVSFDTLDV